MRFTPLSEVHSHDTRFSDHIPSNYTRLVSTQKCMRHYVSKIISKSPPSIVSKISTHSLHGVTSYIKKTYISSYNEACTIQNFYICGPTNSKHDTLIIIYIFFYCIIIYIHIITYIYIFFFFSLHHILIF